MRIVISVVISFIFLTACAPAYSSTPVPVPTEAMLSLQTEDMTLRLHTLTGWRGYIERGHIIIKPHDRTIHEIADLTINVWIPEMDVPAGAGVLDVVRSVARRMRSNPHIAVSEPLLIEGEVHQAAYYLLNDGRDRMSLIMVIQLPSDGEMVALNISNIHSDMEPLRSVLVQLFEHFSVNDLIVGAEMFHHLPDFLHMPTLNPGTLMQSSRTP